MALLFIIVIGAVPIALLEKIPFGNALYFSFVTGLTIGYTDIVMKTPLGRCIALFIGFIGIIFTGLVIAAAIEAVRRTYPPEQGLGDYEDIGSAGPTENAGERREQAQ